MSKKRRFHSNKMSPRIVYSAIYDDNLMKDYNGFHCGECLQVQIAGEWLDTSMEMDWSTGKGVWYLTGTDVRGEDIEYIKARISKEIW